MSLLFSLPGTSLCDTDNGALFLQYVLRLANWLDSIM